jgi:pyruvate,water dikinase
VVLIESVFGLGEGIVKGIITPDEFCIFKPTLRTGFAPIIRRSVALKELKLVYDENESGSVKRAALGVSDGARPSLNDDDIITLARWACAIEEHFQHHYGAHTPMDIEWAKDGINRNLYVVQARPETVHARRQTEEFKEYTLKVETEKPLLHGISVGASIASGPVRYVRSGSDLTSIRPGDVLLAERTEPDWEPAMRKASAIVTNHGGRTCHAAIVSREIGIPAVVGTGDATRILKDGQFVTVTCAEGSVGFVYPGALPFESRVIDLAKLPKTRTRTLLNLANPARAFRLSALPAHGVGLLRIEFIISEQIGIHPLALLEPERITNSADAARIKELTASHLDPSHFFVERLAEGIGTIAAAFYPREVIVRFSDFKSNEYGNLIGGKDFEPCEDNPMLGFRGASRYYHPRYRKAFALECSAIRKVRSDFGLTNVKVMIPFCRTLDEAQRVITELSSNGLFQGEVGFEVYMMCEIPSNIILAAEFAQIFSGFSIGSNDLTQLILGVDRDSEIVAPLFDERNKAVTTMIKTVIREARRAGRKIGICGQAPSDFPEFTRLLVAEGIDSISFNPDSFIKGVATIAEAEQSSLM